MVPALKPIFVEQSLNVIIHNTTLKETVLGLTTTRRLSAPSVNLKLNVKNKSQDAGGVESISILVNQLNKVIKHIWQG